MIAQAASEERFHDARRLLEEIKHDKRGKPEDQAKTEILECYCLMASGSKPDIERALKAFTHMNGAQMDNVPALVGMAVAYLRMKQTPKARNQLKKIAKLEYRAHEAEDVGMVQRCQHVHFI